MNPFPIIQGMPTEMKTGIVYSVCSDGLYETRKLPGGGTCSIKIDGVKGLPAGKAEINFLNKKLPVTFYNEIIKFFRSVTAHFNKKLEAYILICYNKVTQQYFLYVPFHTVGPASVKYDLRQFYSLSEFKDCYIVMDVHCHSGFSAFFSSVDNEDDGRDRFSMVIGFENRIYPEVKVRFAAGSKFIDLELEDIFSNEEINYKFDIETALKQVTFKESEISIATLNPFLAKQDVRFKGTDLSGNRYENFENYEFLMNDCYSSDRMSFNRNASDIIKSGIAKGFRLSDLVND